MTSNNDYDQPDTTRSEGVVRADLSDQAPPWRAMIPVSQLAAHPGNVRTDLDLNEDFA